MASNHLSVETMEVAGPSPKDGRERRSTRTKVSVSSIRYAPSWKKPGTGSERRPKKRKKAPPKAPAKSEYERPPTPPSTNSSRCDGYAKEILWNETKPPRRFWLRHVGENESVIDYNRKIAVLNDPLEKIRLLDCEGEVTKVYYRWDLFVKNVLSKKIKLTVNARNNDLEVFATDENKEGCEMRPLERKDLPRLPFHLKNIWSENPNPAHLTNQWAVFISIGSWWKLKKILMRTLSKDFILDANHSYYPDESQILDPPESFVKLRAGVKSFKINLDTGVRRFTFPGNVEKNQSLVVMNLNSNQAKIPGLSQPVDHQGLKSSLSESKGLVFRSSDGFTVLPLNDKYVAFPTQSIDSEGFEMVMDGGNSRSIKIKKGVPPKLNSPETSESTHESRITTDEEIRLRKQSNFPVIPNAVTHYNDDNKVDMSCPPKLLLGEVQDHPAAYDNFFLDVPRYKSAKLAVQTKPMKHQSGCVFDSGIYPPIYLYPCSESVKFRHPLRDIFWLYAKDIYKAIEFVKELKEIEDKQSQMRAVESNKKSKDNDVEVDDDDDDDDDDDVEDDGSRTQRDEHTDTEEDVRVKAFLCKNMKTIRTMIPFIESETVDASAFLFWLSLKLKESPKPLSPYEIKESLNVWVCLTSLVRKTFQRASFNAEIKKLFSIDSQVASVNPLKLQEVRDTKSNVCGSNSNPTPSKKMTPYMLFNLKRQNQNQSKNS